MVDLRIDMVRTACQYDSRDVVLGHIGQGILAHLPDFVMESLIFLQTFGNGASGFIDGDIIIGENLSQPLSKLVRIGQREEGRDKLDVLVS